MAFIVGFALLIIGILIAFQAEVDMGRVMGLLLFGGATFGLGVLWAVYGGTLWWDQEDLPHPRDTEEVAGV
ncbi:MAG TPA: hypothetical protein VI341_13875 [Actinomycetota bacterium]